MKPSKFSSGERILDQFYLQAHLPHVPFSRLYSEPDREYAFLDKLSYNHPILIPEDTPFRSPTLMRTMGTFIAALNKFFDKDNQVTLFIPDADENEITLYADNIFTLNNVRGRLYEMFEDFAQTGMKRIGVPKYIDSFVTGEKSRILNAAKTGAAKFNQQSFPPSVISADILVQRYMHGIQKDYLDQAETAYDNFSFDVGYEEIRVSEFHNSRFNSNQPPEYSGEKESIEKQKAFEKYWDIKFFEGPKDDAYQKLKAFLQRSLSVTVDISKLSPSTVDIRGEKNAVDLAKKIGIRAVPLINEGKIIDDTWLENALSDLRTKKAIEQICVAQGTYFSDEEAERAKYKAGLKGFTDVAPVMA